MRIKNRKSTAPFKILVTLILLATCAYMAIFVPPADVFVTAAFIVFTTALSYSLGSFFLTKRDSLSVTLFVGLFLTTSYLVGFNIVNTILLLSFIIGLRLLLK